MRIYLASPLGFATATRAYLHELVGALEAHGLTVHDPWGSNRPKRPPEAGTGTETALLLDPEARRAARHARNHQIALLNEEAIRAAEGVIAVLDGVDVDSGTAAEIGFAYALGHRIWGLRTDTRLTGDNEGSIVNLQVQYFIEATGGKIARSIADLLLLLDYESLTRPAPLTPRPSHLRAGEGEEADGHGSGAP